MFWFVVVRVLSLACSIKRYRGLWVQLKLKLPSAKTCLATVNSQELWGEFRGFQTQRVALTVTVTTSVYNNQAKTQHWLLQIVATRKLNNDKCKHKYKHECTHSRSVSRDNKLLQQLREHKVNTQTTITQQQRQSDNSTQQGKYQSRCQYQNNTTLVGRASDC